MILIIDTNYIGVKPYDTKIRIKVLTVRKVSCYNESVIRNVSVLYLGGGDMKRLVLIRARQVLGKTQKEIALALGVSEVYVRKIEAGVRDPGVALMLRAEGYFGIDMRELFSDIFIPNNDTKCIG